MRGKGRDRRVRRGGKEERFKLILTKKRRNEFMHSMINGISLMVFPLVAEAHSD